MLHSGVGDAAIAFVAGLLSFFSPCVAPLVPGYISYLSGASLQNASAGATGTSAATEVAAAGAGRLRVLRANPVLPACLLFVAGFSVAFIVLGLVSASLGQLLAAYQLVLETIAGIVMIIMGAFLLNLLPRQLTTALMREGRLQLRGGSLSFFGRSAPFALGVVFAAGWTPCIGPVLAAILLYVGASADRMFGAFLLTLYALGFALPFLAVGLGWSAGLRALGWVKCHGHAVSMVSGIALILIGLVYLTGQVSLFSIWAQQHTLSVFH